MSSLTKHFKVEKWHRCTTFLPFYAHFYLRSAPLLYVNTALRVLYEYSHQFFFRLGFSVLSLL